MWLDSCKFSVPPPTSGKGREPGSWISQWPMSIMTTQWSPHNNPNEQLLALFSEGFQAWGILQVAKPGPKLSEFGSSLLGTLPYVCVLCSAVVEWSIGWVMGSKCSVTFLIFCPASLSIVESEVFESPTFIHYWILFLFPFFSVLLYILWAFVVGCIFVVGYILNCFLFLMDWPFYHYKMSLFIPSNIFCS